MPVPPPLVYLAGLLAGIGLHALVGAGSPSALARIIGAAAGGAGFAYFDTAAMTAFRRERTTPMPWRPASALVTSGPYRITRNPMYVGMAALFAGLAFAFGTLLALLVLPLVLVLIDRVVIAREEPYLERRFGAEYVAYKRRVRRWL